MASTAAEVAAGAKRREEIRLERPPGGGRRWMALAFLAPAIVFLGAIVIYPTIDTFVQSFQTPDRQWIGIGNYRSMFDSSGVLTALKNNAIWVATAPAIITGLGLMFAILTERVSYQRAIKIVLFMPMAISFLATGVIWRIMYEEAPDLGFVNAGIGAVYNLVSGPGPYPQAQAAPGGSAVRAGNRVVTKQPVEAGNTALMGLTAITPAEIPPEAQQAAEPQVPSDGLGAVVWNDFKPGGGESGVLEEGELGLPNVTVQLLDASGGVVQSQESAPDGSVVFSPGDAEGPYKVQISPATFAEGFGGVPWLGEGLVTPAIIGAFCWMWAGFSVVVIGAGLAALPRDVLEAARVDGANEWQTFRYVTVPLLRPVLGVVFVTMVINVLKIFDIVLVLSRGDVIDDADVIALRMWRTAFTARQYGVGSAIAVLLFVLVVPVMVLNIKRFRRET